MWGAGRARKRRPAGQGEPPGIVRALRLPGASEIRAGGSAERYTLASRTMIPEVFECPRCERQFVIDSVPDDGTEMVHCPQCSRYLGVRDIAFVLRGELDEMIERLTFEKDRLEKDEAVYSLTDCDPEMRYYGREVSRVIQILRSALKDLNHLRQDYKVRAS